MNSDRIINRLAFIFALSQYYDILGQGDMTMCTEEVA